MTVIFLAVSYITKNYTRSLHTAVCPIHSNNSLLVIPSSIISLHLVPLVFPLLILHLFQARSLAIISSSSCLIVCYHLRRIAEKGFFLFMTLHLFSLDDIGGEWNFIQITSVLIISFNKKDYIFLKLATFCDLSMAV